MRNLPLLWRPTKAAPRTPISRPLRRDQLPIREDMTIQPARTLPTSAAGARRKVFRQCESVERQLVAESAGIPPQGSGNRESVDREMERAVARQMKRAVARQMERAVAREMEWVVAWQMERATVRISRRQGSRNGAVVVKFGAWWSGCGEDGGPANGGARYSSA